MRTVKVANAHGNRLVCYRSPKARIDKMGELPASLFPVLPIRPRGAYGFVGQSDGAERMLDRDCPGTAGAKLPSRLHKEVSVSAMFEQLRDLIVRPPWSDGR